MSVFDEQPPIINVSTFSHWLKKQKEKIYIKVFEN